MVRKILTAIGYVKAPKTTFMVKHPVRGASAWIAYKAARKAAPAGKTALKVAGAVVALPLALSLFRRGHAEPAN